MAAGDDISSYPLLQLPDGWQSLMTKSANFDSLAKGSEVLTLAYIRELQGQRNACCVHKFNTPVYTSEHNDLFKQYLSGLGQLLAKGDPKKLSALRFDWSSPMAGKPTKFWRLSGVALEQAMAQFLYAGFLQARGYQCVDDLMEMGAAGRVMNMTPEQRSAKATEAATLLRQAAGVYQHLAEVVAASIKDQLEGDRPAELCSGMSQCLQHICLAEAQAVVCQRAEEKGTSAATLAALHMGASDLFEQASKALKESTGQFNTISDRLRRFIAVSSTLHMARSYKHQGRDLAGRQEAGQGEACCVAAQALLKDALAVAEVDSAWKTMLLQELVSINAIRQKVEVDRVGIYYQPLPTTPPAHVKGAVMVKPVPYEIEQAQEQLAGLALEGSSS